MKCTVQPLYLPWHAVPKHSALKEKSAEENKLLRRRHYTVDLKRNRTGWLVVWGGEASLQVFSDDVTVYSSPRLFPLVQVFNDDVTVSSPPGLFSSIQVFNDDVTL